MSLFSINSRIYIPIAILFLAVPVQAEEPQNEYGLRVNVLLGDGTPANDVPGFGLIGRRYLDNGWFIGGSLDTYAYDFERPYSYLGIALDPALDVIDADGRNTVLGGHLGREYGDANSGWRWFWTLGLGIGSPSVDSLSGPTDTGGTFDLKFDAGTEFHLMSTLGTSYYFSSKWSASLTARAEYHAMDIRITDTISGATTKIDSQTPIGAYLSLNYRF